MKIVEIKQGINGTISLGRGIEFVKSHYHITKCLIQIINGLKDYANKEYLNEDEQEDILAMFEVSGYERLDVSSSYANLIKGTGLSSGVIQKHMSNGMINAYRVKQIIDTILAVYEINSDEVLMIVRIADEAMRYLVFGFNRQFNVFDFFTKKEISIAVYNAQTELNDNKLSEYFTQLEQTFPPILSLLEEMPDIYNKLITVVDPYIYVGLCEVIENEEISIKDLCDILDGKISFEIWKTMK